MDTDDEPRIIAMPVRGDGDLPPVPLALTPKYSSGCDHMRAEIDKGARTLTCSKCGVSLDPIEYIHRIANYERRMEDRINELRRLEKLKFSKELIREARREEMKARRVCP